MPLHGRRALKRTCWGVLLMFLIGGIVDCQLVISVPKPSVVDAKVGGNVTLELVYTGAVDPAIEWRKGGSPIVTWAIGSSDAPDIAPGFDALRVESNGSLTFRGVQLRHAGEYTVRLSKPAVGTATAAFTLRVFDDIKNVSVSTEPAKIVEGIGAFVLLYSTSQGEADSVKWLFKGQEINGTRLTIGDKNLTVRNPTRGDTGRYTLNLTNPFSSVLVHKDITVLYGPDEPVLGVSPQKTAFELGDSLSLSCAADGDPAPTVSWVFGGLALAGSQGGTLNLTNVQTNQSGVYTCVLVNDQTGDRLERNFTIDIYERPSGSPMCSVGGNSTEDLQYRCQWPGGDPEAQLSFPALNASSSGRGEFNLTVTPSQELSGREVTCVARHPLLQRTCSVTARGPAGFLPVVSAAVDSNGTLVVTIACASASLPVATVTWSRGGQVISGGGQYRISPDTTVLSIVDPALDTSDLGIYTCDAANPLGHVQHNVRLIGPKISEASLTPNQDGTMVNLTWETPPSSIITGFEVQMTGPDLTSRSGGNRRRKRATDEFRTVQKKPADARGTNLGLLDPKSHYQFRVVPVAGQTMGEPSKELQAGPGGLSEAAIAGIAAGVPCAILLLILLILLIVFCACKRKRRQTRYPVSRAVEKVVTSQPHLAAPHKLLTGGLKSVGPPDYGNHQGSSERSSTLPSGVSPQPVRMATTV